MIFQFPDLETFRLAVTSAQVPAEVSAAPAEVAFDPEGRPSVRSAVGIPPKPMQNALRKMGVKQAKQHYSETILTVDCWPQILPVAKAGMIPEITSTTPVLFEMPVAEMAAVVTEMLRLGNDRQSFRTVAPANGQGERVLLKVIGPPYYTLLRAIDKSTQQGEHIVAYIEKAPRVWVEIGHDHPLAAKVKPAEQQILLLRPERDWTVVEDGPFQDVYEVLHFQLPVAPVEWQESQLKGKLTVPLRLAGGNAADAAELWVLTDEAVDQLDAFVRDADERLLSRLSFAVANENGQTTIILKTRPSRLDPPVLPLAKALAFKPYWKLPNLFLPVGKRLMPTLRRDAVRKLLANDPDQVVWLVPTADGKFAPEVLPDDAFRPLEDWIDYVIDHEHESLQAWVQNTRFDFDSFICPDDSPDKPKRPPSEKKRSKKAEKDDESSNDAANPPPIPRGDKRKADADETDFGVPLEVIAPNEVKVKLRELEKQFLAAEGALDSPDRQALWPELAKYNALDGRELEAAICWTNAFWELPDVPAEWSLAWLKSEDRNARKAPTIEAFDAAFAERDQSPHAVRTLTARVIHACQQSPPPDAFLKRLPKIREYLERHETMLGVRAAWLAWWHLARIGGQADVLALARVRDRLLQRLLGEGLNKERDLPYFLRTAGEQNNDRMRMIRDRAMKVHKLVEKWHARDLKGERSPLEINARQINRPYVDLMFGFGMAKLGEVTAARELLASAKSQLLSPAPESRLPDPARQFLFDAFAWRVENAIQGKPHSGPLPTHLNDRLARLDELRGKSIIGPRYIVDRLRHISWVLEPQERLDPYASKNRNASSVVLNAFATIRDEFEPNQVKAAIGRCLRENLSAGDRLHGLNYALQFAPRAGQEFTIGLVKTIPNEISRSLSLTGGKQPHPEYFDRQCKILEKAVVLAAHYDFPDLLHLLFECFVSVLSSRDDSYQFLMVSSVAQQCVRSLRKCGMKTEIEYFLGETTKLLLRGQSLDKVKADSGTRWPEAITLMLSIAEGWLALGDHAQALPYIDEARSVILDERNYRLVKVRGVSLANAANSSYQALTKLICGYIATVVHGPAEEAFARIEEVFSKIGCLPNSSTSATYYSGLHLQIVDTLVRSLISDNITLGDQARRWLDDDEFLVRRRIHGDMKKLLSQSGL